MAADSHSSPQDDLVQRILREILSSDRLKESSVFSERSYEDEPILRTGADLKRQQDARKRQRARRAEPEERRPDISGRAPVARRTLRGRGPSPADIATYLALVEQEEDEYDSTADSRQQGAWAQDWDFLAPPRRKKREPLPPRLQELRKLGKQTDAEGARLRGPELFVRQGRLVQDYTDDFDLPLGPQYRYYPSYQELSNDDLRGYFSWRTKWRNREVPQMHFTYVRLLAAELVNGIGAERGEATLVELERLYQACVGKEGIGMGPGLLDDLHTWIRDYVVYFGLDPKLAATEGERAYARDVAILRAAEREVLARKGLGGLEAKDAPEQVPTDAQVWQALGNVSSYATERSPFFRAHPEAAAAVGAGFFRRMVEHCAKRRKTLFVDGIVGEEQIWSYTPFLGLPFLEEGEHEDVTVRITACETISHRFGRWRMRRGFERKVRDKELGHMLKAIDRQMRLDWGFGRALKEQKMPKYVQRMIVDESAAEHAREEEAERRRIKIDLSQLGHIRSAAATTREALLVDEEREAEPAVQATAGAVPGATPHDTPAASAAPAAGTEPQGPASGGPLGLTELELEALRRLLDGRAIDDLLGPGAPMASVLVDSINEKLFDEIGDSAVEFGDDDSPKLVEDYADDVRALIG